MWHKKGDFMAQEVTFDKNKFTELLFDSGRTLGFAKELNTLFEKNAYSGPLDEEDLESYMHNTDVLYREFWKHMYNCYKNPESQYAQDFKAYWNFIKCIFDEKPDENSVLLVLNKLPMFDEKNQYSILRQITPDSKRIGEKNAKIVSTLIINNPLAPLSFKSQLAFNSRDKNLIRTVIEMCKQELDKEMHKDFPNPENLKNISDSAKFAIQPLNESEPDYVKLIKKEFDINKILSANIPEYMANTQKSLEEELIETKQQLQTARNSIEEITREKESIGNQYNNMLDETSKEKEELQYKNEKLVEEMNRLQATNDKQSTMLKQLKIELAKMKTTGLFNKNAAEIKKMQDILTPTL